MIWGGTLILFKFLETIKLYGLFPFLGNQVNLLVMEFYGHKGM